jgi:hypothetical protein
MQNAVQQPFVVPRLFENLKTMRGPQTDCEE